MKAIQLLSSQTGAAQKIQLLSAFLQAQNLDGQSVVFEEERERVREVNSICVLLFTFLSFAFCIFVFLFCVFVILCCIFCISYLGSEER